MTASNQISPDTALPIACDPYAIPQNERETWIAKGVEFYAAVRECRELADGYALRLEPRDLMLAAEYVSRDRLCCAFLRWEMVVEPGGGALWLNLRGPEGTQQFLRHAFEATALLPENVARAARLTVSKRRPANFEGALEVDSAAEIARMLDTRAKS